VAPEARGTEAPDVASVLATERLVLRRFTVADAPFILVLLNDPDWLEFIGDKGVRTLADARNYLRSGPIAMYEREGFGLYLVERRRDRIPIGMCGLIKRPSLADVDIGFAFLPDHRGQGYAHEATVAVMAHGRDALGLERIVAITSPGNARSAKLLEKLGMTLEKTVMLDGHDHEVVLYASDSRRAIDLRPTNA
jgi:RimJ/RimL family protein N-acetyltransferase